MNITSAPSLLLWNLMASAGIEIWVCLLSVNVMVDINCRSIGTTCAFITVKEVLYIALKMHNSNNLCSQYWLKSFMHCKVIITLRIIFYLNLYTFWSIIILGLPILFYCFEKYLSKQHCKINFSGLPRTTAWKFYAHWHAYWHISPSQTNCLILLQVCWNCCQGDNSFGNIISSMYFKNSIVNGMKLYSCKNSIQYYNINNV